MQRPKNPIRHYHRLALYDYSRGAALFVTISTAPRRQLFGAVREAVMALSPFGAEVEAALRFTIKRAEGFRLYGFVVMPDHVHFRLYLEPGHENREAMASFNTVVGKFKSYTTHLYQSRYGGQGVLWQEGFHDWVCESREMIDAVERYMAYNALKWELRHNRTDLMKLYEPIYSPRFESGEYWRGVEWLPAIKKRRLAIVARGNSPDEFGRNACLDLNAAIIPIAKCNGRALWWQSDGRFRWL